MTELRPKLIIYRYNGVNANFETAVDEDGAIHLPKQGAIIERRRARWKVQCIKVVEGSQGSLPIYTLVLESDS
jgi:hypothetical protein